MKYNVGDMVQVKTYEQMANEYDVYTDGDIKTKITFVKSMRVYCGKIVTIKEKYDNCYYIKEDGGKWR